MAFLERVFDVKREVSWQPSDGIIDPAVHIVSISSLAAHYQLEPMESGDRDLDRVASIEGGEVMPLIRALLRPAVRKVLYLLVERGGEVSRGAVRIDGDQTPEAEALFAALATRLATPDDLHAQLTLNAQTETNPAVRRHILALIGEPGALSMTDPEGGDLSFPEPPAK